MKKLKPKSVKYENIKKPILIFSASTLVFYALMLFKVPGVGRILFCAAAVTMCFSLIKSAKNKYVKIIIAVFFIAAVFVYLCLADGISAYIAGKCSSNPLIFGAVSAVLNTFGIYDVNNLVYFTSYGGARLINDSIVCGAVNIANAVNGGSSALYLTGRIVALFSAAGILITAKGGKKAKLLIIAIMLFSGIETPCLLFLLLCDLPLYFLFLIISFAGYFISSVLSVKAQFLVSPSLYEILLYSDNKIYIICFSVLFCAVSYYLSRLVKEKRM